MLIRGLGPGDGVESRAHWRKGKACREEEVHAGFTRTHTHTRRRADVHHEDHTLDCTGGSLSVEGTTVPPLSVCTGEKLF